MQEARGLPANMAVKLRSTLSRVVLAHAPRQRGPQLTADVRPTEPNEVRHPHLESLVR